MIPLTPAWPRQPASPLPAFAYITGREPAAPLPFPQEERNQTRGTPRPADRAQPQLQISTSAWRKAARASHSRLLLASTLLFLIAMMLVLGLMNIQQQAHATATASSLPYAPYHGKLVLNDPLHNPGTTWETSQNSTRCAFHAGSYHVIAAQDTTFATCRARGLALTNFALQVEMTLLSGDRGGIVFRLSQAGGYFFSLDRAGHYSLAFFNDKTSTSLLNGSSSAIVPGQAYLLAVIAVDQQLELYVNQQKIASVRTTTFNRGTIAVGALAIRQFTEATFNDLKVWQL